MLGGTTLLDEHGRILWVERPYLHKADFYIGRSAWEFTAPGEITKQTQAAFSWALAMGGRVENIGGSGQSVPDATFRYDFERLPASHYVVVNRFAPWRKVRLTPTEERVAGMLVQDWKSEEISEALGTTHNTTQTHRRNVLAKVGVRGVAGLTRWWEERKRWHGG